ncbi:MAG: glycosyltransferase family 4 protein [Candidatus Omnitrophica bacterium]|nr:glycosyltransferase family 4 protein [Candidatus Omnitrophota bacterium]
MSSPTSPIDLELLTVAAKPRVGGMTSWFDQIARGLSQRGWRVRLVAITDRIEGYEEAPFEMIHLPLSTPSNAAFPLIEKWSRWRKLDTAWDKLGLSPARIRLSDGTPGVLDFASKIHKKSGVPWAVLMGGDVFAETQAIPFSSLLHSNIRKNLLRADRILVDGSDLKTSLVDRGIPPELIRVHYHGIDLQKFREPSTGTRFFPERSEGASFRLVWHGRLSKHHGPERFLQIASRVPNSIGRLCGGGDPPLELKNLLREDRFDNWSLGFLPDSQLVGLLHEADCGVYPLKEMAGVPTVLLESMAAGLPTLTLRTGACEELIDSGKNGFILDTPERMIECLNELRSDPDRQTVIGEAARETIATHWSLEAMLKKLEEILEELLQK